MEYFSSKALKPNEVIEKYKMQFRYKTKRMTWEVFKKRYGDLISEVTESTINNLKSAIRNTNIKNIISTIPTEMQKEWSDYLGWIEMLFNKNKEVVLNRLNDLNRSGGSIKWI